MRRFLALALVFALPLDASAEGKWAGVHGGMDVFTGSYPHRQPLTTVPVVAVRFDQASFRLNIVDLTHRRGAPTLNVFSADVRVVAAINGAYVTSYAFPRSLGFARIRGETIARMNPGKLFSGLICLASDGHLRILRTKSEPGAECSDALQSGPLIVENSGANGIGSKEPAGRIFERSVICVDDLSRVLLIRSERTALYDLGEFLRSRPVGCRVALNLSGDADAGLLWREHSQLRSEGSLVASLATALVVTPR
jgi:hypothetical protein